MQTILFFFTAKQTSLMELVAINLGSAKNQVWNLSEFCLSNVNFFHQNIEILAVVK